MSILFDAIRSLCCCGTATTDEGEAVLLAASRPAEAAPPRGELPASGLTDADMARLYRLTGEAATAESGLVPGHVESFKQVAEETDSILMFRPVNKLCTALLAEGFAVKGLEIHGKSSDWGPMAGCIPFDQRQSKCCGNSEAVSHGNQENQKTLQAHGDRFMATPLRLSRSRLDDLMAKGIIAAHAGNGQLMLPAGTSGGAQFQFRIDAPGGHVQYRESSSRPEPWQDLLVMADRKTGKPLTADYDLFAILPRIKPEGFAGGFELDRSALREAKGIALFRNTARLLQEQVLGQPQRNVFDPELGRIADWQRHIRHRLNEAVRQAGYQGGDIVKHGTEQDNTQFPEQDRKIFVILPDRQTLLIEGWDQVAAFMHVANRDSYAVYQNRAYNTPAGARPYYPGQDRAAAGSGVNIPFDGTEAARKLGVWRSMQCVRPAGAAAPTGDGASSV